MLRRASGVLLSLMLIVPTSGFLLAQGNGPELTLDPVSGPPGALVQADGTGYSDASCGVRIYLDSTDGTALGDADLEAGVFSTEITIPEDTSPGEHDILAVGLNLDGEACTEPSGEEATATFTVEEPEATVAAEPAGGPPGSVVVVFGQDFSDASCGVGLYLDDINEGPFLGDAVLEDGEFQREVVIPKDTQPGKHVIIGLGLVDDGETCGDLSGEEATVPFEVAEPDFGPFAGDPVTPVVQDIDLSKLPTIEPWQPGDPIQVGPGQSEPGEDDAGAGGAGVGDPAGRDDVATLDTIVDTGGDTTPQGRRSTRSRSNRPDRIRRTNRASDRWLEPEPVTDGPDLTRVVAPRRLMHGFIGLVGMPIVSFDAIPGTGVLPPDIAGDVGPDHFIQMVNAAFAIYDKDGNLLAGPSNINSMWAGVGGPCETDNDGDPDVKYDPLADRWVMSQFVAFTNQCIAVSRTADPVTGGWYLYDFDTGGVTNDYPKLGVWPDGYYMGSQRGYPSSGSDAWAFDRASMLDGDPATFVRFNDPGTFLLPSDHDGATLPPDGAPNVFVRQVDGAQLGGADRLEMMAFDVDFDTPANSTFTVLSDLATAPFDRNMCGFGLHSPCVPQPTTTQTLAAFTAWPQTRLQYRKFDSHETLVFNHTVDADGNDHAGVRWYELQSDGTAWSIVQQQTYAPDDGDPGLDDDVQRWMGSAAMDKNGNLALGYSVSSDTEFPGIRYAGRFANDPPDTLPQGEITLVSGAGAQTHPSGRWGDYSTMTVDPVDDCTFWFTTEYYASTTQAGWSTRVGSFRLDAVAPEITCPADATAECVETGGTPADDSQLDDFFNDVSATDDCDLDPGIVDDAPAFFDLGDTDVTFTATDDEGNSDDCIAVVSIEDTIAPTIVAPPDLDDIECTSPLGASPALGTPSVDDVCDDAPMVGNDAPPVFPLGTTTVTWEAIDISGNVDSDTQDVTVVDTAPPVLAVQASPSSLWPPNHKMVDIDVTVVVSDICDVDPEIRLISVTSDEPDNGNGDGNTVNDIQGTEIGTDDRSFRLRAERMGGGDGRVYTITYQAEDDSGNTITARTTVVVPHDQGNH